MTVGELKTFLKTWEDDEAKLCFGTSEEDDRRKLYHTYYDVEVIGVELGDLTFCGATYQDNSQFTPLYPKP